MNNLKFLTTFLFSSVFLLSSCDKDDMGDKGDENVDQPLQGMISGEGWTALSSIAQPDRSDKDKIRYNIVETQLEDVCNNTSSDLGRRVFFSLPNQVGVYQLYDSHKPNYLSMVSFVV